MGEWDIPEGCGTDEGTDIHVIAQSRRESKGAPNMAISETVRRALDGKPFFVIDPKSRISEYAEMIKDQGLL